MSDAMKSNRPDAGQELDRLLAAYRDACDAPEPTANFMPQLWDRIEASKPWSGQAWAGQVWLWARGLTVAAAMASLFLVMLQMAPRSNAAFYSETYLESLADQHDNDEVLASIATSPRPSAPESPLK